MKCELDLLGGGGKTREMAILERNLSFFGVIKTSERQCFLGIFIKSGSEAAFSLLYLYFSGKGSVKYNKSVFQSTCWEMLRMCKSPLLTSRSLQTNGIISLAIAVYTFANL